MNAFSDLNLSNSVLNLHCSPAIHNCFAYVDDCQIGTLLANANSTTMGYGFFECISISNSTNRIPLQIYSKQKSPNRLLLHMNAHFATINGLKNEEKVLLAPINRTYRCSAVELCPSEMADWDAIVENSSQIEEIFLSQIRVIRSGMSLVIFLASNGIVNQIKFSINVPSSSSSDQNFLLDMNTHVVVLPGNYDEMEKGGNICSKISSKFPLEIIRHDYLNVENGEEEEAIGNFILPKEKCGSRSRILPFFMNFCPKFDDDQNPFFNVELENFVFFNALPFVFIAAGEENDEIFGLDRMKKYLVEISLDGNKEWTMNAILCPIPATTQIFPLQSFLGNLAETFEKANRFGLEYCWLSEGIRRTFQGIQALQWIKIRPLPLEKIKREENILFKFKDGQNVKENLEKFLAISRRLKCPWIVPSKGLKMEMKIGKDKFHAELLAKKTIENKMEENWEENFTHFFWPFSAKLQIEIENCAEMMENEENGKNEKMMEKSNLFEIPAQGKIVGKMHSSINSSIKFALISRNWSAQKYSAHQFLIGPVGSGKSTILKLLAEKLRRICADDGFLIENDLVDCAGKTPNELLNLLGASLARLNGRWPSAILLDNFDWFAEKILHSEEDELVGRIRMRKIYQNIFSIFANFERILILCSANCKMPEEMLLWEGRPFFDEFHEIEEFSQEEQKLILAAGIGDLVELEKVKNKLKFPTICDLMKIIERAKLLEELDEQRIGQIIEEMAKIGQNIGFGEEDAGIEFDKIAGLEKVKQRLSEIFIMPSKYPKLFSSAKLSRRAILYGPSGNGKTLLLRALANKMGVNVLSVKGPELYSKYIGESEQKVRQLFAKARSTKPTLIVFDEFDALAPQRGSDDAHVTDRVVNQLLTELDGFEGGDGVDEEMFVIAATNRLDIVDKALLRPGRFEQKIFVEKPNFDERLAILNLYTKMDRIPISNNVNLGLIAESTEGLSGAEMRGIVQNAFWAAERRGSSEICQRDFQMASNSKKETIKNKIGKMNEMGKKLAFN